MTFSAGKTLFFLKPDMRHIYVFGPPGSQKTVLMIKANADKFGTTEDSEWITLVHGLFDEMENPFQKPNVLEVVTRELFEDKARLDIRFHTQVVDGRPHPAVEFTVSNQSGPGLLALADAQILGDVFRQFIQASWVKPLIAGRLANVPVA